MAAHGMSFLINGDTLQFDACNGYLVIAPLVTPLKLQHRDCIKQIGADKLAVKIRKRTAS